MARTNEEVLRDIAGNFVLQIAGLTAQVEALQTELAASAALTAKTAAQGPPEVTLIVAKPKV